jgi:transcription initiation factor TFIID TATA-box-binding protein
LIVSADFGRSVNLEALSEQEKVIYEPEQFPAAIVRVEKPHKTTILVFASGKTVITGLKSEVQVLPTIDKIEEIIDLSNKYRMH